jgi:ABC-type uncharacterized transport system permease subunit
MQLDIVFVLVVAVVLLILGNSRRYRYFSNSLLFGALTIIFVRSADREFQRGDLPGGYALLVPAIACMLLAIFWGFKRAKEFIAEMRRHL